MFAAQLARLNADPAYADRVRNVACWIRGRALRGKPPQQIITGSPLSRARYVAATYILDRANGTPVPVRVLEQSAEIVPGSRFTWLSIARAILAEDVPGNLQTRLKFILRTHSVAKAAGITQLEEAARAAWMAVLSGNGPALEACAVTGDGLPIVRAIRRRDVQWLCDRFPQYALAAMA